MLRKITALILSLVLLNAHFAPLAAAQSGAPTQTQTNELRYKEYLAVLDFNGDGWKSAPEYKYSPLMTQRMIEQTSKNIDEMMKESPEYKRALKRELEGTIALGFLGAATFIIVWALFAAMGSGAVFAGWGGTYTAGSLGASVPLGVVTAPAWADCTALFFLTLYVGYLGHSFLKIGEECAYKYLGMEGFNAFLERKTQEAKRRKDKISTYSTANNLGEVCQIGTDGEWASETHKYYAVVILKSLKVIESGLKDTSNEERFGMAWLDEWRLMNMFGGKDGSFTALENRSKLRGKVRADNKKHELRLQNWDKNLQKIMSDEPFYRGGSILGAH